MIKIILLCALLLPSALPAEEFTMDTYYPSPVGVYNNITVTSTTALASDGGYVVIGARNSGNTHQLMVEGSAGVNFVQMTGYTNSDINAAAIKPGETKPLPGRLLFNRDQNKFYYTSVYAEAGDQSTWLLPLDGFDSTVMAYAESSADYAVPTTMGYVRPLSVSVGTALGNPVYGVRLLGNQYNRLTKSGLYIVQSTGKFCVTGDDPPRVRINVTINSANVATFDEEVDAGDMVEKCYNYNVGGMIFLRAGQSAWAITRAKRDKPGDYVKAGATIKVERILSF